MAWLCRVSPTLAQKVHLFRRSVGVLSVEIDYIRTVRVEDLFTFFLRDCSPLNHVLVLSIEIDCPIPSRQVMNSLTHLLVLLYLRFEVAAYPYDV